MNLQKIKEALESMECTCDVECDCSDFSDNLSGCLKCEALEALAEFEKPADADAVYYARLINDGVTVSLDEDAKLIQQYAEAYHQQKCAECKNAK